MLNIKLIQVARIRLDWDQMPRPDQTLDESNAETSHPFAADLDITGGRSLHRLLDSAVTREGSHRLNSWLLNGTPDPQLIAKRQSLVHQLKSRAPIRAQLQR